MPPRVLELPTHTTSPSPLRAQVRQRGAVEALRAEHVDVVELGQLLRGERLGRTGDHVARVVHDYVEAALLGEDGGDGRVGRLLRRDVELDGAQVDAVLVGVLLGVGDGRRRCGRRRRASPAYTVWPASASARAVRRRTRWTHR